jgi:hypothetical protein
MPVIDLTRYIVASAGTWTDPTQDRNLFDFTLADTQSPERLLLRWAGDFVALTGPLRVRVTVQAENLTLPLAFVSNLIPAATATFQPASNAGPNLPGATAAINTGAALYEAALGRIGKGALSLQAGTIYTYTLDIAAGQAWPFSLSEQLDALRLQNARYLRSEQLGNNLGYRVIIEPAFTIAKLTPVNTGADLPCDFAVANQPDTARFFPVACEPCEGSVIGLPPSGSVALVIPPADGGCVRTRFFNGMFITREDLETEQRYHRLKSKLHNRAAGAGVVWGLVVGKRGDVVCVLPGYGVDCCGNDVVLTSTYQVDIAALLADPAAAPLARTRNAQRLNLLLEYVECPSDPRPVHGDPCAPEASRCEMSRIRESVRLRLVPPCDYNAATESAPLQRFLDEVRKLRALYPISQIPTDTVPGRPPFQIRLTTNNDTVNAVVVRPASGTTNLTLRAPASVNTISVEVLMDPLWTFVNGTLSGQASPAPPTGGTAPAGTAPTAPEIPLAGVKSTPGRTAKAGGTATPGGTSPTAGNPPAGGTPPPGATGTPGGTVDPPDPIDLSLAKGSSSGTLRINFTLPATAPSSQFVFRLAGWRAQTFLAAEEDPAAGGDLTLTLVINGGQFTSSTLASQTSANPLNLASAPCAGAPCAAGGTGGTGGRTTGSDCGPTGVFTTGATASANTAADPTPVLPWLHTDPVQEASPGDPKALALAALGGWLAQMLVREQAGTANEIASTRREVAQAIYRLAWVLLFGVSAKADPAALGCSLQRLLEGWCDSLLWTGPHCCCDPHGVVIGCAVMEGGTIQNIDPFGGRRYVVHYPLLEHWGAQFGIAPLDITATRFFSKLCCLAGLPAAAAGAGAFDVPGQVIQLGGGYLAVGDPNVFSANLKDKQIVAFRKVSTPEMIVSALSLIGTKPASSPPQPQFTALVLADVVADQSVTLLVPAP